MGWGAGKRKRKGKVPEVGGYSSCTTNREGTKDMRQGVDTSSSDNTNPEVQVSYVNTVMGFMGQKRVCQCRGGGMGWSQDLLW